MRHFKKFVVSSLQFVVRMHPTKNYQLKTNNLFDEGECK